jgi:putative oxidoreductase
MLDRKAMLSRYEEPLYAILRIVAGAMFTCHGLQKIVSSFPTAHVARMGSQAWVGGILELVCGVLIALGLLTRPAAFIAAGEMAVAYFQFHWKLALADGKWIPLVNHGELAVLYCFVFLYIFARGPGLASLDGRIRRRPG